MYLYIVIHCCPGKMCAGYETLGIYIVPTGLYRLSGCFLFYQYFAPIRAVP